jgi:catechol 2,3-dioxygenase-like lactoylglutathione lyase family enzyme
MGEKTPVAPDGLLEAAVYARELLAAERFYRDVLGLRVISSQPGRHVFFRSGGAVLLVFNPERTSSEAVRIGGQAIPAHGTQGAGHVAFAVAATALTAWREHLRQAGITIEIEIDWPQGGHSIYLRDPAGNSVELATPSIWPQLSDASKPAAAPENHLQLTNSDNMNLLALDQHFFTALINADTRALEHILAQEFILIDVNSGSEIAKPELLNALGSGQVEFESIEPAEQRVRRFERTVIVTGRTRMKGRLGHAPFAKGSRYTHVYVEQEGGWRLVAAQGTQVSPELGAR